MSYFRSWFIHLVKKKLPPLIFYAFCTYSDHQSSKFRSERVICDTLVINTLLFTKYTIKGKELNYLQIKSFFTLPEQYKLIDSIYGQAFSINIIVTCTGHSGISSLTKSSILADILFLSEGERFHGQPQLPTSLQSINSAFSCLFFAPLQNVRLRRSIRCIDISWHFAWDQWKMFFN